MVGEHDADRAGLTGNLKGGPQLPGHFRGGLDAGQARADHNHRQPPRRISPARQRPNVCVEPLGAVVGIHVKGKFREAANLRPAS